MQESLFTLDLTFSQQTQEDDARLKPKDTITVNERNISGF